LVNQLVLTEDGSSVQDVMVGGRMVVEGRRVLTVDMAALAREAEAAMGRLNGLNAAARALAEAMEPAVGAYCVGLARKPYPIHHYGGPPGIDG
ncbi:MAG: amidohydrolase, partial [Alphaproteobacteria bacterium]|nr:amidohydrolase [Alphaproteobacteria bacterium]